jgi:hypothetical protein
MSDGEESIQFSDAEDELKQLLDQAPPSQDGPEEPVVHTYADCIREPAIIDRLSSPQALRVAYEIRDRSEAFLDDISRMQVGVSELSNFLLDELKNPEEMNLQHTVQIVSRHMACIMGVLRRAKDAGEEQAGEMEKVACTAYECVELAKSQLAAWVEAKRIRSGKSDRTSAALCAAATLGTMDPKTFTPSQRLKIKIMHELRRMDYRRYKGDVYRQIELFRIRDRDGNEKTVRRSAYESETDDFKLVWTVDQVFQTHSWERVCDMEEIVYELCSRSHDMQSFMDITRGADPAPIAKYLARCKDPDMRQLEPDRYSRSFTNGVLTLNGASQQFYLFRKNAVPPGLVCTRHYDEEFPLEHMFAQRWNEIPTPCMEKILRDQRYNIQTRLFFYAMVPGRMQYPLKRIDDFQVAPVLLGEGGTGKSTAAGVVHRLYNAEQVGTFSSNMEQKFGLAALADKMVNICWEMAKARDFGLPATELLSIIEGGEVSCPQKFGKPRMVVWHSPLLFLGNDYDRTGSQWKRRLLFFPFNHKPKADTKLEHKLRKEQGSIILKSNIAHQMLVKRVGPDSIWDHAPPICTCFQRDLEIANNPVKAFVTDRDRVILHPSLEVAKTVFNTAAASYFRERRLNFSAEEVKKALRDFGIKTVRKSGYIEGAVHLGDFYVGCGIRQTLETQAYEERERLEAEAGDEKRPGGGGGGGGGQEDSDWDAAVEMEETRREQSALEHTALLTAKYLALGGTRRQLQRAVKVTAAAGGARATRKRHASPSRARGTEEAITSASSARRPEAKTGFEILDSDEELSG